jgi:hypothetical protein
LSTRPLSLDELMTRGNEALNRSRAEHYTFGRLIPKSNKLLVDARNSVTELQIEHMKHSILVETIRMHVLAGSRLCCGLVHVDDKDKRPCGLPIQ